MRSFTLLAVAVIAALPSTACGRAQQPSAQQSSRSLLIQVPPGENCPVGFSVHHANQGGMVKVSPGEKHPEQGYRINFRPLGARSIVQARITLHGLSGARVIPAGDNSATGASESFTLAPSSTANHLFQSTVFLHHLTGVQWVELNELTYADGTHWQESADNSCRVTPGLYMLVAGRN